MNFARYMYLGRGKFLWDVQIKLMSLIPQTISIYMPTSKETVLLFGSVCKSLRQSKEIQYNAQLVMRLILINIKQSRTINNKSLLICVKAVG